ncbi:MAG: hypothetical protein IH984_13285 [Planctomycetes bacterium]|nr:hypothetical protein [Planctomycetota bacterium]
MSKQYKREWSGNAGYVNCLLVTIRRAKIESVSLLDNEPVPNLIELARDNTDLKDWLVAQQFSFDRLNPMKVVGTLKHAAGFRWYRRKKTKGSIHALDVGSGGKPIPVNYELQLEKLQDGNECVNLTLVNSEDKQMKL